MNGRYFNAPSLSTFINMPVLRGEQVRTKGRVFIESMFLISHVIEELPKFVALGIEVNSSIHPHAFLAYVIDFAYLFIVMK